MNKRVETKIRGFCLALKQAKTGKGEQMCFGTFIDRNGDILDTVYFPETARKHPFYGKGIYKLIGVISEKFGYYTIEIGEMTKLAFMEDVLFSDEKTSSFF